MAMSVGVAVTAGTPHVPSVTAATTAAREDAARVLWNEHYAPLAGWCASLVGDREVAHDIASEAFTRLLSRWFTVHDPKGYLYVTATNLVRDRWRREQRDRRLQVRLEETTPVSTPACDPWLRDLVERLPDRLRAPVLLHYYADMSVAEVASALHRPEGTIKRMLFDARAQLAGWLGDER
jgi:RNA polymerase sigma-70 factor (ECF subfamily)